LILLEIVSSYKYVGSLVNNSPSVVKHKNNKRMAVATKCASYDAGHKAYYKSSLQEKETEKEQNKLNNKSIIVHPSIGVE